MLKLLHCYKTILTKESSSNAETVCGLALSIKAVPEISQDQNPGLVSKYFFCVQGSGVCDIPTGKDKVS